MSLYFECRAKTDEKTVRSGKLISVKKGGNPKLSETLPFPFVERSDARIYKKESFVNLEKVQTFEEYLIMEQDSKNPPVKSDEMTDEVFEEIVKKSDDEAVKALWNRLQNSEEVKTFSKEVELPKDDSEWNYEAVYKNTYVSCAILYEDFIIIFEDALIDSELVDFEKVEPEKLRNLKGKKPSYKKRSMRFEIAGGQQLVPFKKIDSDGKEKDCYGYITINDFAGSATREDSGDLKKGNEIWLTKNGDLDIRCGNLKSDSVKQWIVKTVSDRDELSEEDKENIAGKYHFAFTCSITVNIKNCTLFGDPEKTEKVFIDEVLITHSSKFWVDRWIVTGATGNEKWRWNDYDELWEGPMINVCGVQLSLAFQHYNSSEYGMMLVDARELVPFYNMQIKTASGGFTGTDSDITVVLHGEYGDYGPVRLNGYVTHSNAFEEGMCDGITIGTKLKDRYRRVGRIYQIDLKSNMKWAAPGWKPEFIDVSQMMFKYGFENCLSSAWEAEPVASERSAEDYVSRFFLGEWIDSKKTYGYTVEPKAWSKLHAFLFVADEEVSYDKEDIEKPNCHVIPRGMKTMINFNCGRDFVIEPDNIKEFGRSFSRKITPEEIGKDVRIADNDTIKLLSSTRDYTTARKIFESLEKPERVNKDYIYYMSVSAEGDSLREVAEKFGYAGHRGNGSIDLSYDFAEKAGLPTFGETAFRTYRTTITKQHLYGALLCNDIVAMVDLGVGKGIKVELLKNEEFVEINGSRTNYPDAVKNYNTDIYKNATNDSVFVNLDGKPLPKDIYARANSYPTICPNWEFYIDAITEKERSLLNKDKILRANLQFNMLERESLVQIKRKFLKCDPNYKESETPGRPPAEELPESTEELQRQIVELNNINAGLLEDNARLLNDVNRLTDELKNCGDSKTELENQIAALENDNLALINENAALTEQNKTLQQEFDKFKESHEDCENTIGALTATVNDLQKELSELKAKCPEYKDEPKDKSEADSRIAELENKIKELQTLIDDLKKKFPENSGGDNESGGNDEGRLRRLEKRLVELKKERDYSVRRIGSIQLLLMNKQARPSDKKELEELKAKLPSLDSQIKALEEELKSLRR